jgi:hypothetical protein
MANDNSNCGVTGASGVRTASARRRRVSRGGAASRTPGQGYDVDDLMSLGARRFRRPIQAHENNGRARSAVSSCAGVPLLPPPPRRAPLRLQAHAARRCARTSWRRSRRPAAATTLLSLTLCCSSVRRWHCCHGQCRGRDRRGRLCRGSAQRRRARSTAGLLSGPNCHGWRQETFQRGCQAICAFTRGPCEAAGLRPLLTTQHPLMRLRARRAARHALARHARLATFQAGDAICCAGAPVDRLVITFAGQARGMGKGLLSVARTAWDAQQDGELGLRHRGPSGAASLMHALAAYTPALMGPAPPRACAHSGGRAAASAAERRRVRRRRRQQQQQEQQQQQQQQSAWQRLRQRRPCPAAAAGVLWRGVPAAAGAGQCRRWGVRYGCRLRWHRCCRRQGGGDGDSSRQGSGSRGGRDGAGRAGVPGTGSHIQADGFRHPTQRPWRALDPPKQHCHARSSSVLPAAPEPSWAASAACLAPSPSAIQARARLRPSRPLWRPNRSCCGAPLRWGGSPR